MRQVAAVILAAGEGKRFRCAPGETKLTALLDGKPLVRHVAEAALGSRARPVLVVTGHAQDQVLGALAGLLLERIHDSDAGAGLSSALKLGISALPPAAQGAVILLGDMPLIGPKLIDRLIDAFAAAPALPLAVVPVRRGQRGNPALIGQGLFAAVETLKGDKGAHDLIAAVADRVLEVDVDDISIALDVDTRSSLHRLQGLHSRRHRQGRA